MIEEINALLDDLGFDSERSILTERQAQVLALRERDVAQADIADALGTSRANVSSIERSARDNVTKSRETVAVADALRAPVRIQIEAGTDLYDVPQQVYDACDEADVKVEHTAPELMKLVSDAAEDDVSGRHVEADLVISVTATGTVHVRRPT